MTDRDPQVIEHDPNETPPSSPNWGRSILIFGVATIALAGAGVVAVAQTGWGKGEFIQARMGGFAERRFERMLEEIDATDEQSDKLMDLFDRVRDDVLPKAMDMRGMREEGAALLLGATVDPAAVEKFRADRIAQIDALSKTMTAAMVEASQTLTPEQRAELKEHFEERRKHRRW